MANIIESSVIIPQESEDKVFMQSEIVRKKLLVNDLCHKSEGLSTGRSLHMNFRPQHGWKSCKFTTNTDRKPDKMWNFVNTMGHPGQLMGPYSNQKRDFSLHVSNVPIATGKVFANPNFVNKHHPSIHSYQNNFILTPIKKITYFDSSDVKSTSNSALVNSSQSIVDTIKQNNLDICKSVENSEAEVKVEAKGPRMCISRKRCKRNRRRRRRRSPGKNSKQNNNRQQINDMMDMDVEIDSSFNGSDLSMSPKLPGISFSLIDFIVDKAKTPCNANPCGSDEEDLLATIVSVSPPSSENYLRQRQVSVTESEDSYIVFGSGTDEELVFSEESDDESESDEDEDEVDSSSSVIPHKKVRFAEESDLCEVHPMVQWSYAYQQARKGPWEEYARDRDRFKRRIADMERILSPIFSAKHRDGVYEERFKDITV